MDYTAKNLKTLLRIKGLTQADFARKMGRKQMTVSGWVNGINKMPLEIIIKICDMFNITLDDFVRKEIKLEAKLSK